MATYFDFEKKHAHINRDDVYVKRGEVKDDKLVLEYSVEGIDPLSISLSALDKMTYIDDAEFKDNSLVLKHNRPIADLSINLSSLDKHVAEVKKADDESSLSLCFNDGTFLSIDTTKFAEDNQVTSCYVNGNNLVLERNNGLAPLIADLDKFNTHVASWEVVGNDLVLRYNDETPALSVALDRFHKHIDRMQIDGCDQLTLSYADDVAAPLSADLSKYARNYYVNEAALCGETIVLKRNSADAGEDLSVDVASLNNYIASASIDGKTLVLAYNSGRLAPLSIGIADFIKDYHIADVKLCADNKLHFKYNKDLADIEVDLSQLNDHIVDIKQENDILQFVRTNGSLPAVNLAKYVNNNLSTMHMHGNSLVLKFDDGRTKDVSLDKFDKHIAGYEADENSLSLLYNGNKGCIVVDKKDLGKNVSAARVEDRALWLDYSDGSDSISAALPSAPEVPDMYLSAGKLEDSQLVLEYADSSKNVSVDMSNLARDDEHIDSISIDGNELKFRYKVDHGKDTSVCLSAFDNELLSCVFVGNVLSCKFANGKTQLIDFCQFNKFIQQMSLNGNSLALTYNDFRMLSADLSKFDKCIANASVVDGNIIANYNDGKGEAFRIPLANINYELSSGEVDDNCKLALKFTNGKDDVAIDASKLKSPDTYISSIMLDNDSDILTFDYNQAELAAKSISLHKFARNDYVANGRYDENAEKLILGYNDQAGFQTKLPTLSIDIPRRCEDYKNALSSMSFKATDEKSILSIAQAIEQIVTAFGGNKQS